MCAHKKCQRTLSETFTNDDCSQSNCLPMLLAISTGISSGSDLLVVYVNIIVRLHNAVLFTQQASPTCYHCALTKKNKHKHMVIVTGIYNAIISAE